MPSADDYKKMFRELLPEGPIWDWIAVGADTSFDKLISALNIEFGRVDALAEELLNRVFPDDPDATDLESWERITGLFPAATNIERLANIRAKLRGRGAVNRLDLQDTLRELRSDSNLRLLQQLTPPFVAEAFAAGGGVYPDAWLEDQWAATWICEYMPQILTAPHDGLWSGTSVVANYAQSPITLSATAQKIHFGTTGFDTFAANNLLGTADNDDIYFSGYFRALTGSASINIGGIDRSGGFLPGQAINMTEDWQRVEYRTNLLSGATPPALWLAGTSQTFLTTWGNAGIVNSAFETAAKKLFPLGQTGIFRVIGEDNV